MVVHGSDGLWPRGCYASGTCHPLFPRPVSVSGCLTRSGWSADQPAERNASVAVGRRPSRNACSTSHPAIISATTGHHLESQPATCPTTSGASTGTAAACRRTATTSPYRQLGNDCD